MHSNIIQLSKEPLVNPLDYIAPWKYEDDFIGRVADYVAPCDRKKSLNWIFCAGEEFGVSYDAQAETLTIADRQAYFREKYDRFIHIAEKVCRISFGNFCISDGLTETYMSLLRDSFDNETGLYVDSDEFGLVTFDRFMRCAEAGVPYHIGNVLDYHC